MMPGRSAVHGPAEKRPRPSLCVRKVQYFTGELWLATSGRFADVWRDGDRMDSRALV